jgi:hypothetical protein
MSHPLRGRLQKRLQMILPGRKVNFDSLENGNEGSMKHKKIFIIYCVTEASRWVRSPWVHVKNK